MELAEGVKMDELNRPWPGSTYPEKVDGDESDFEEDPEDPEAEGPDPEFRALLGSVHVSR